MTRARAKAVEEKTKTVQIPSATTRATSATKSVAAKRKTAADDVEDVRAVPARPLRKASTKPTLSQSRRGVQATTSADATAEQSSSKQETEVAGETTSRPRKTAVAKNTAANSKTTASSVAKTRTRAEPVTRATATSKKAVTFKDQNEDKENATVTASKDKKTAKPISGIANRPVRPSTTTAATKRTGKVAATRSTDVSTTRAAPLSPKKDSQVAKGNKTETAPELADSIDELQLDSELCMSPTRKVTCSVMASPARRLPDSPFKNAFKETLSGPTDVVSSFPAMTLSQSPKKFTIASPGKATSFDNHATSSGNALFGSPARKPSSPVKCLTFGTPIASNPFQVDAAASTLASRSPQRFTPAKDVVAIKKAAEVESINALLATVEEHAASLEDELLNAPSPFSPVKKAIEESLVEPSAEEPASGVEPEDEFDPMDIDTPRSHFKGRTSTFPPRTPGSAIDCDDDSEDELSTDNAYHSTPAVLKSRLSLHFRAPETPVQPIHLSTTPEGKAPQESLTVLASRFGQWQTGTPDPAVIDQRKAARSIFSPLPHLARPSGGEESTPATAESINAAAPSSCFEEAMPIVIHEDEHEATEPDNQTVDHAEQDLETQDFFRQSLMSEASQIYGDENEMPIDPALLSTVAVPASTSLSACTPQRTLEDRPRIIHTVSKVPLKGCDDFDVSPIAMPRKRSHSLARALSPRADLELQAMRQIHPMSASDGPAKSNASLSPAQSSDLARTLPSCHDVALEELRDSPSKVTHKDLLKGAVVFVDVHTTEGADASGLFVELLTQMGAKCVKSWSWNSKTSPSGSPSNTEPFTPSTKVGITHVVFKDGGKRTMEKVREAHGRVSCVGMGWVLE